MVLAVAASLGAAAACRKSPPPPAERAEGIRELQDNAKEFAEDLEQRIKEDGSLSTEGMDQQQEKLAAAATKIGGKLGQGIQAINELNGEIAVLARELEEMTANISSLMDWEALVKEKDYQRRREFLVQFAEKNQRMLTTYQEYPGKLTAKLDAIAYTGPERTSFESETLKGFTEISSFVTSVRNDDLLFVTTLQSLLDALEKEHGNWSIEDGNVVFENEELLAKFNETNETIQKLGARQIETQNKLVEHMKASASK